MDISKLLDTESSVEIRMFDNNSNKAIYKILTIRQVKQILEILDTSFPRG